MLARDATMYRNIAEFAVSQYFVLQYNTVGTLIYCVLLVIILLPN